MNKEFYFFFSNLWFIYFSCLLHLVEFLEWYQTGVVRVDITDLFQNLGALALPVQALLVAVGQKDQWSAFLPSDPELKLVPHILWLREGFVTWYVGPSYVPLPPPLHLHELLKDCLQLRENPRQLRSISLLRDQFLLHEN